MHRRPHNGVGAGLGAIGAGAVVAVLSWFGGAAWTWAATPDAGAATPLNETHMPAEEGRAVTWIKPKALKPGDTIMFIAPAGELGGTNMARAKQRLEERGYRVIQNDDLLRRWGYLAGPDERRAEEFMQAFTDPEVDAVFPGTGGYGATRMLDLLDFEVIRKHPKVFIGFSDITALHLALNRHAGLITYHSPNPMWGLGSKSGMQEDAERYFWAALEGGHPDTTKVTSTQPAEQHHRVDEATLHGPGYAYRPAGGHDIRTISPGVAQGRLIGGNLSLLASTMGTRYEMDTRGAILFIEDIGEQPYRIDRMLRQLQQGGKFDDAVGVVLGQFSRRSNEPESDVSEAGSLSMDQVLKDYFAKLGKPVLGDFPMGHVPANLTLPVGVMAELNADTRTLRLLESPVTLPGE